MRVFSEAISTAVVQSRIIDMRTQHISSETHNQIASVGSIKGDPSALHLGSPRRVHRCEYMQKCLGRRWSKAELASLVQPFIGCQPVARPSTLRGAQKVWSSADRFFREARLRLVSVEGKLPPWSRTIRPRVRPGSSLDPSSNNRSPS